MPRRNRNARDKQKVFHEAVQFYVDYPETEHTVEYQAQLIAKHSKCIDCFFAGRNFICTTSDGRCLKTQKTEGK